jgi:hypothetical protein
MCLVKNKKHTFRKSIAKKQIYVMCLVKNQKHTFRKSIAKNKFMLCCLVKNQKQIYVMLPCKKPKTNLCYVAL